MHRDIFNTHGMDKPSVVIMRDFGITGPQKYPGFKIFQSPCGDSNMFSLEFRYIAEHLFHVMFVVLDDFTQQAVHGYSGIPYPG